MQIIACQYNRFKDILKLTLVHDLFHNLIHAASIQKRFTNPQMGKVNPGIIFQDDPLNHCMYFYHVCQGF